MSIDSKTRGAWVIHHTDKLQSVTDPSAFENIFTAGKAGKLLSALSTSDQLVLDESQIKLYAQQADINKLELDSLLKILKDRELVDIGNSGVEVLGLTTTATLEHTSMIFDDQDPSDVENIAIEIAEKTSELPQDKTETLSEFADIYSLDKTKIKDFEFNIEEIGLVDIEKVDSENTIYFNGNLFKRDEVVKTKQVLNSLQADEEAKVLEFNTLLDKNSCISIIEAEKILGKKLFLKLSSIGMYDINVVSNATEDIGFITKPSSFSKYSKGDDAFDLAKAFVSSLTYGMTRSSYSRGQITDIEALLRKLISGGEIGPVDAIGQDYKILERKHVIQIKHGTKINYHGNLRSGWIMKLLKKDVGELALQAIKQGNISDQSLISLPGAAINKYSGPEINRTIKRKKITKESPKATNDVIMALRTGGI